MLVARIFLAISVSTLIILFLFVTFYDERCTLKTSTRQYFLFSVVKSNGTSLVHRAVQVHPTESPVMRDATIATANVTKNSVNLEMQSTFIPAMDKHNFTSLPEWEFDDIYRLDPQFNNSVCTTSLRNSTDPLFSKMFIPNIQLFLQNDHLNVSEWNRLYHFNNPFGYMGVSYTAIKAGVDTIPKLDSTQILQVPTDAEDGCIRCAVVGTSGILNGSGLGTEIDSNHYVFRMNAAIIAGHEEDVGRRTSVYVHTAHSLITSLMLHKKRGFTQIPTDKDIKYVLIPEGPRDYNFLESLMKNRRIPSGEYRKRTPRNYYSGHFNESSFYVLHPDFLRYVRNRFLKAKRLQTKRWWLVRPTNGAFTLLLAMHTCDIVRVYGFSTADHWKYPNYYYDTTHTKMVFFGNHDYPLEMQTWRKLHDDKHIWLYLRNSDS